MRLRGGGSIVTEGYVEIYHKLVTKVLTGARRHDCVIYFCPFVAVASGGLFVVTAGVTMRL